MSAALDFTVFYEDITGQPAMEVVKGQDLADADARLVNAARTGDFAAFEELVRRYRNDVYGLAYHFLRNREEAWDVSQEVFIKAHRSLARFRGDSSFKTWLMRITANQCKDFLKKRRLDAVPFDEAIESHDAASGILGPDTKVEANELGEAITKALEALPVKHRTAFVLREFEGLSYEEMATVMDCNLGTVMSRLHHARKKLQTSLARMGFSRG
ncbi:MAG TPA: sigma-70 family RNA polymerase sigma factor [Candidatus Hydrogenedentes bacterium]|nr:sigma-70 family RNA polymerase sigma factor [Candidatus Hydrogenedentota bacterium]HRK35595.1 sigma-70 family RNA polymerase sigma factor [Candidatus Hydrogenedentota bacterium]